MKQHSLRLLSVLLCLCMLIPLAACGENNEEPQSTDTEPAATEVENEGGHHIARTDYDSDFIVTCGGTFTVDQHIVEEAENDGLTDAVYERQMKIKDWIGVNLVYQDSGDWVEYAQSVIRAVNAGDDAYQLVMTPVYRCISQLITTNVLYDMNELPTVNFDAPYWHKDLMTDLEVQGRTLLGYNDFCLSQVHLFTFNKDMYAKYSFENPYDLVRNKQWTIDKMFDIASNVAIDNGDGKWTVDDTYGLAGWGWVGLISFITASDLKIVDRDEDDHYYIAYEDNEAKMLDLIDKIKGMYNAEYSWLWKSVPDAGTQMKISDGRALFMFDSSPSLIGLRDSTVRFGVLPYPMYDENQENYRTLNWNGMLCIPSTIKNEQMVSDTMELLPALAAPVKDAFYEQLLGAKLADAQDDVDMLNVIWNTQVSDVGIICDDCVAAMDSIVYMIPQMLERGNVNFASWMKSNKKAAQRGLDNVFEPKTRKK